MRVGVVGVVGSGVGAVGACMYHVKGHVIEFVDHSLVR